VKSEAAPEASAEEQAKAFEQARIDLLALVLYKADGGKEDTIPAENLDALRSMATWIIENAAAEVKSILFPTEGPKVEVEQKADGRLSILGPSSPKLVLRLLREATDDVLTGLIRIRVMESLAQPKIAKPSMREVLGLAKR